MPLAAGGLAAGAALSFARGIAEFGATLFFAGSFQGVTQTLPLAVYAQFDVDFDVALAISALLVLLSAAILLTVKLLPRWTRSGSTSTFRCARSSSSSTSSSAGTVALVGPSGAGKNSVLRAVAGLVRPERADRAR